jgi:hypothetical protein
MPPEAEQMRFHLHVDHVDQLVRQMDLLIAEQRETNRLLRTQTQPPGNQEDIVATMEELQAKIDEAIAEVQENTDVVASASTVMSALSQQLQDAVNSATDPAAQVAAVQTVIDGLNANNTALAEAIDAVPHPEQQ